MVLCVITVSIVGIVVGLKSAYAETGPNVDLKNLALNWQKWEGYDAWKQVTLKDVTDALRKRIISSSHTALHLAFSGTVNGW